MGIEVGPAPYHGPSLHELSQVHGRGLIQVIVSKFDPFSWHCFINGEYLPDVLLEDLLINICVPDDGDLSHGKVQGYLCCVREGLGGKSEKQVLELFPSTVDLFLLRRRITISCADKNDLGSVVVSAGLSGDGDSNLLEGAKSLEVIISRGILDVRVTWMGGRKESLFQSSREATN